MKNNFKRFTSVCFVFIGIVTVLGTWMMASPIGSSPDDDYHLASAYCAQGPREGLCDRTVEGNENVDWVPEGVLFASSCYGGKDASCQTIEKTLEKNKLIPAISKNGQARSNSVVGGYPKLFYFAASQFVTEDKIEESVLRMRLFNISLISGLFALAISVASGHLRRALVIILCVVSVPLGLFLFSSNNPSSWTIAAVAVLPTFWIALFTSTSKFSLFWALIGALSAITMTIGSRPEGVVLVSLALFASSLYLWESQQLKARSLMVLTVLASSFGALTGRLSGRVSSLTQDGFSQELIALDLWKSVFVNINTMPGLLFGAFGLNNHNPGMQLSSLGWLDTPVPSTTGAIVTGTVISIVLVSLNSKSKTKIAMVLGLWSFLIVVILRLLSRDRQLIGFELQPRYFLPVVFLAVFFAVVGEGKRKFPKISNSQFYFVGALLSLAHSLALHACIARYSQQPELRNVYLNQNIVWWWTSFWSPQATWLVGSFTFSALILMSRPSVVEEPRYKPFSRLSVVSLGLRKTLETQTTD